MYYKTNYKSALGNILLCSSEESLVGLWFEGQKYFKSSIKEEMIEKDDLEIFKRTKNWLDRYFKGEKPDAKELTLMPEGSNFRQKIWKILLEIPYGKVKTYGEIAKIIASQEGKQKMSAQAVGGAIGHNPISIIIPCHRVIGSNGSLTGYAGGIEKKIQLLRHEGAY